MIFQSCLPAKNISVDNTLQKLDYSINTSNTSVLTNFYLYKQPVKLLLESKTYT